MKSYIRFSRCKFKSNSIFTVGLYPSLLISHCKCTYKQRFTHSIIYIILNKSLKYLVRSFLIQEWNERVNKKLILLNLIFKFFFLFKKRVIIVTRTMKTCCWCWYDYQNIAHYKLNDFLNLFKYFFVYTVKFSIRSAALSRIYILNKLILRHITKSNNSTTLI